MTNRAGLPGSFRIQPKVIQGKMRDGNKKKKITNHIELKGILYMKLGQLKWK